MNSKVISIGIDGGDFALVGKWLAEGKLPNLKKIADGGVFGADGGVFLASMAGGGSSRVELVSPDAIMVMEVRMRCGAALACGDSTARELLQWSFTDDQSMVGENAYTTRDVPWPERVYVKVSRRGGPAGCDDYFLRISR